MLCWFFENSDVVAAIGVILTALFTLGIAVVTCWAANATRKASQAQILVKFMDEYASKEMNDSLMNLRQWSDGNPLFAEYKYLLETKQHEKINESRRFVKSYFFSALSLYENKFVNDKFMKVICENRGIEILFEIVEPLEYSLSDYLDQLKKSSVQVDTYQYGNLESDLRIKFDRLRELKKEY